MKIFEIVNEDRRADTYKSGAERLRDIQKYQQSTGTGLSGQQIAKASGKYNIGGLDQEEIIQKDLAKDREVRLRRQTANVQKDVQDKEKARADAKRKKEIKTKRDDERYRREKLKQQDKDASKQARSARVRNKQDNDKGYRKDAAGRTLRNPRYYKGGKTAKGKTVAEPGSIRQGIDNFLVDPIDSVADYYNDKVKQFKDYLNTTY